MARSSRQSVTVDDVLRMRSASDTQISPDGKKVAFVLTGLDEDTKTYYSNVWVVSADGGDLCRFTTSLKNDSEPRWSPGGSRLAFLSDRPVPGEKDAPKKPQIWIMPADGGEATRLTRLDGGASNIDWSPDSKSIAFSSPETAGKAEKELEEADGIRLHEHFIKMWQIWVVDVKTGQTTQLTRGRSSSIRPRWSPDGKLIAFEKRKSPLADEIFSSRLCVVNPSNRRVAMLTGERSNDVAPEWSPDGKRIAFVHCSDPHWGSQNDVAVIPVSGGRPKILTAKLDRNESAPMWSAEGKQLFFVVPDGIRRHLYRVRAAGGAVRQVTRGTRVVSGPSISGDGKTITYAAATPTSPGDVYVARADGSGEKRLTHLNSGIERKKLAKTKFVRWKSVDGLRVEGVLVLPAGRRTARPFPLIVEPHGGPAGVRTADFYPDWQLLAANGYAVFAPNFRGSDGYGKAFIEANVGDFGGMDFQDITTGVDMLIENGVVHRSRIGVRGTSYGGFMSGWLVSHDGRFKAAVAGSGVYDWQSQFGTCDIPSFTDWYQKGAPWRESTTISRQSPFMHVENVKAFVLLYHGEADRRVTIGQSEEMFRGLKRAGVTVQFVRYPKEGHGIKGYHHRRDLLIRTLDWFGRYVKGSPRRRKR